METVQISSETFSSLDTIRVTQNETSGDSLLLTSEISFRLFVSPTHAGSYFCRVSVSGAVASFSQSNSQTYDMETDAVINLSSTCEIYADSFTQSTLRCAGNVTSTGLPSASTDNLSTNIDPVATSNVMSSLSHISILDSSITMATNNPLQPDRSIIHPWIYVLVGMAALIVMIMIIIVIACIICCLKKSKTMDSFTRE